MLLKRDQLARRCGTIMRRKEALVGKNEAGRTKTLNKQKTGNRKEGNSEETIQSAEAVHAYFVRHVPSSFDLLGSLHETIV